MNSATFSYPAGPDVLADLGDKVTGALALAVQRARSDLQDYRRWRPQWVADHSERGLANWISDRIWTHLNAFAEDITDMVATDQGPLRELTVGITYRFRVKRHDVEGKVASYPTEAFLDFTLQPTTQLPGMEEIRLIAGYDWLKDQRDVGAAVISMRDGKDNVIWKEYLPEIDEAGGDVAPLITPETPQPAGPTVDVPANLGRTPEESAERQ